MSKPAFIGIANYLRLFQDDNFRTALANTCILTSICVLSVITIALFLALIMRSVEKYSPLYSLIYFIPVVIPWVPAAVIWRWILDPKLGILNYGLAIFGLHGQSWLQHPETVLIPIVLVSVWKILGYYMLIFAVGLRNIPDVYYEAAKMDGAGGAVTFWSITLPLLKPIVLFSVIMAIIQYFNIFTLAYSLSSSSQGSPSYEAKVLVWDIYRNSFEFHKMGYASAEAMTLLAIVLVLILIQFRAFRTEE
jgi:multiple sugar transport system permease protein